LAEARDALLQQVELSHHHQEQLEDEKCITGPGRLAAMLNFLSAPNIQTINYHVHLYKSCQH
jgi:hypothetical protein